jgi:Outer membrane protein beta-barrel domain
MKTKLILAGVALFAATAFPVTAQTAAYEPVNPRYENEGWGARAGDWEMTLGGGGGSNKDFDDSLGGIDVSIGYFFTDSMSLSLRQSANYSNGNTDGAEFDGSSFLALDYHFGSDRLQPFVGVNAGRAYGDNTNETWVAGLETGLKFYVKPQTFVFALVNYAWAFEDSDIVDDAFDEGSFLWTVGIGFNF